jgi:uncharacterized membrane protein YbhN (UPF0104 family)
MPVLVDSDEAQLRVSRLQPSPRPAVPAVLVPGPRPSTASDAAAAPATAGGPTGSSRRTYVLRALGVLFPVATVAVLALELRHADLGATFAAADLSTVALAQALIALSILAAAYNLIGFSPLRLRLAPTLLAQLAVGGLRLFTPAALSTPAVAARYLVRSGAALPDALATVGASQVAQLLATAAIVAGLGAVGEGGAPELPSGTSLLIGGAVLVVLVGIAVAVARLCPRVRSTLLAAVHSLGGLATHARRHPSGVVVGFVASAALTLTHVLAFAACVAAVGGSLSILHLTAIYLGAAAAGSIIPTPGGFGPVEAALVAGLVAGGMVLPAATAATLLSRAVAVWLPALPGGAAIVVLRRRQLL